MGNLGSAVDELLSADLSELDVASVEAEFLEVTAQIERLHAARLERLAILDAGGIGDVGHQGSTAGWLREETMMSGAHASIQVHLARDLAAIPLIARALADGLISLEHARQILLLRRDLPDEVISGAAPELIAAALEHTPDELRRWVSDIRHGYGPDKPERKERDQYESRRVTTATTLDGMGVGSWQLPPLLQETVTTALAAFSRPHPGDTRTAGQRRADALGTIMELALASGKAPSTGGVKPHVTVIVPLETLELRAGAPAAHYGFGTSTTGVWARRLLCDAGVARILTHAGSEILDAGRAVRTFTPAQIRGITVRDRGCIWPGCETPAGWCQAHHVQHWADGGRTDITNGVLLCGHHHDRVHLYHHQILQAPDGTRTVNTRPGSAPHPRTAHHSHSRGSPPGG